jgi:tetratricopeptide (TPR) repeat protein
MKKSAFSKEINRLFAVEDWAAARALLEAERSKPGQENDHWLLTRLGTTYYEEGNYREALKWARQAHSVAPTCPLVLWDLAGTLDALGRSREALRVYLQLLGKGADELAEDECGEGRRWANALRADCVYRAALCLKHEGKKAEALKAFKDYLHLQDEGAGGIYTAADAEQHIKQLSKPSVQAADQAIKIVYHSLLGSAG